MQYGLSLKLGNGAHIWFWEDRWLPDQSKLSEMVTQPLSQVELEMKFEEFIYEFGEWRLNTLESLLSQEVARFIHSQHIDLNMEDSPSWRYNASGAFSTRSTYMSQTENGNARWKWKNLWKLKVPQRSRMFMWLLCSESLLTNVERNK